MIDGIASITRLITLSHEIPNSKSELEAILGLRLGCSFLSLDDHAVDELLPLRPFDKIFTKAHRVKYAFLAFPLHP